MEMKERSRSSAGRPVGQQSDVTGSSDRVLFAIPLSRSQVRGRASTEGQTLKNRVIQYVSIATFEIDDEVYEALRIPEGERSKAMKQELAVSLYARDVLSFSKARALAELSKREFHTLLGEREIPRHYTEAELAEDFEYAQ
nr:UPF0175 family protein [Natronomonas gomsonensis]